jgi:hypothetical protein
MIVSQGINSDIFGTFSQKPKLLKYHIILSETDIIAHIVNEQLNQGGHGMLAWNSD